jgi:hypothetical protein
VNSSGLDRLAKVLCGAASAPASSVFGDSGYIWEFGSATMENWQSEFLQLLAMVVLTSFLIHRGSAESKSSATPGHKKAAAQQT